MIVMYNKNLNEDGSPATDLDPVIAKLRDAGTDLKMPYDLILYPGQEHTIDTGIVVTGMADDEYCTIAPRGGSGCKYGIAPKNTFPVIDASFDGPGNTIKVVLRFPFQLEVIDSDGNTVAPSRMRLELLRGDKFCQLVFHKCIEGKHQSVVHGTPPDKEDRGSFGSSGR